MAKLQEFQSLKSCGYITIPFSAVWSQDNFLAYITDKGVNVFELRFSGSNRENSITVKRWFVKPRQFFPTYDCLINVAKLGETLRPDQLLKVVLDRTLSPKACLSGPTVHASAVAWSPFSHPLCDTSLLTVLTDQGSLDIYSYGESNWVHVACVTDSWLTICRNQWDNNNIDDDSTEGIVRELHARAYRVKITAFSWGECHDNKWFSLFTSNQSGEIMEWRVEVTSPSSAVQITQLVVLKTDLDSITCLHCLSLDDGSFMLLMGCVSGKIQCLVMDDNRLKTKSMLWSDMDQMPLPLNGPVGTLLPQGILYLVPKLGHLVVFWLDTDANLINFSTYSTDDICISGIGWLRDSEFLVGTRSGDLLIVRVSLSPDSLDVAVERCEPLSKNNSCSYHGVVLSPNKCIFAVPYSVCTPHDPSVVKEPTALGLYHNLSSLDQQQQQYLTFTTDSFYRIWDYLELFRLDMYNKKELEPMETESLVSYDSMGIVKLKKVYWLKKCRLNSCDNVNSDSYKLLESLCNELKRVIVLYYLFTRIKTLTGRKELSEDERNSLVCARLWLSQYCADGLFKSYRRKAEIIIQSLKSIPLSDKETCPLCSSESSCLEADLKMRCKEGHVLPRCPRTLLPFVGPPYYTCYFCSQVSTYGDKEFKVCIMCDAPLRFNSLLLRT